MRRKHPRSSSLLSFIPSLIKCERWSGQGHHEDYYREAGISLQRPIVDVLRRAASRCDFILGGVRRAGGSDGREKENERKKGAA